MHPVRTAIRNYVLIAATFLLLIIFLPANKLFLEAYKLTPQEYHSLQLLVEIPVMAVWLGAFLGYAKFEEYAFKLIGTKDGEAYAKMASGSKWLAYSLPIPTILYFVISSFAGHHPVWQAVAIIISDYVGVVLSLVAFYKMSEATRMLRVTRRIHQPANAIRCLQLAFAALGVLYCYLVFKQLNLSSLGNSDNPYYLPVWLLVLTLIIPYLYAWFLGLLTAFDMWLVASRSAGYLYRKAILLLATGLVVVVATRIGEQYSLSVMPGDEHYSLNRTLVLVYLLYLISMLGFTAIIYGINRLKQMEEV
jgi:hypothetical protein